MSICQAGLDNEKPLYSGLAEVVDYLSDEYGWSRSVPNLSGELKRGSLRYGEAVELADALGMILCGKSENKTFSRFVFSSIIV